MAILLVDSGRHYYPGDIDRIITRVYSGVRFTLERRIMIPNATPPTGFSAFAGDRLLATGPLAEVAIAVKMASGQTVHAPILIFDDSTGRAIDLDLRGSHREIVARLPQPAPADPEATVEARGRGRPKLGVVSREVTLLPRHWEWLNARPGGASVTLRKLVEDARRSSADTDRLRAARDAAYHFMSAMAGDRPGFEEASRALFKGDVARVAELMAVWPADIRQHLSRMIAASSPAETPVPPG
jgi:hypothetical protein